MKALVLVNGELYKPEILRSRIQAEEFGLVLGVDGGARHAHALNAAVDTIIGDMDSISEAERQLVGSAALITYPARKDESDMELAVLYAVEKGANQIVIAGAMGGRMDMTISNILLLARENLSSCRIELWHGEQTGWIIRPPGDEIRGEPGDTVSLIPLGGSAAGITTEALEYPLKDAELLLGMTRGTSNVLERAPAHVYLKRGLLLAVHTPGRA